MSFSISLGDNRMVRALQLIFSLSWIKADKFRVFHEIANAVEKLGQLPRSVGHRTKDTAISFQWMYSCQNRCAHRRSRGFQEFCKPVRETCPSWAYHVRAKETGPPCKKCRIRVIESRRSKDKAVEKHEFLSNMY